METPEKPTTLLAGCLPQVVEPKKEGQKAHTRIYRPQVHMNDLLGILPTMAIILSMGVIVGSAAYFLDNYVVTAERAMVVFVVGSYVIFSSYFTFDYFLKHYSSSYPRIATDKQFYVLSNLIKSAVLLAYTGPAAMMLYSTIVLDQWPTERIRIMGTLYAIPDFVSLFMVRRMMWSTIIHHIVVCVFNMISLYNDYGSENICRNIMVYAVFSTFAYLVNLLLASRWMNISRNTSIFLSLLAFVIYASCCAMNWSWQAWYLNRLFWNFHHFSIYLFVAMMFMIVWDDIILLKWLLKNVQTKLAEGNKPAKKLANSPPSSPKRAKDA
eukprot:TRINITY_DN65692_c0_g5_i1.p2 TRINITY_DN65692_c0_g5~~TRINITY_DN65692_c0_g5_i1.p2  ORF type:complete len:337 (+),score=40.69 TRINITY_DN65692_c0_g5_i1:38-1012(+)